MFGVKLQPFTERGEDGDELFLFVYPCCKDNDVMNGERERVGEREREISRLMPGGMSDKPVYV